MNNGPDPTQRDEQDMADEALAAAEQHQQAEEDADEHEQVVLRDSHRGGTDERPAQ